MSKALFGAMAMFYAVGAGSGGGGGLTPPASLIGAVPQLYFGTVATTGGYLENHPNVGTVLADGMFYDGTQWVAEASTAAAIVVNSDLPGIGVYANQSLTVGSPFTPSLAVMFGNPGPWQFFTDAMVTGAVTSIGGAAPGQAVDGISIYYAGAQANIVARTFPSGTYQAINVQTSDFLIQVHNGATLSAWELTGGGSVVQAHGAQSGVGEVFYDMSVNDDGTALTRFKNGSTTNGVYIPDLLTLGSSTNIAFKQEVSITTDTGTNPCWTVNFDKGGVNVTTRPWFQLSNSAGTAAVSFVPLTTGSVAALYWGVGGSVPALSSRSVGSRVVLQASITGSNLDYAMGVETSYVWISSGQAAANANASGIKLYGAGSTTPHGILRADGLIDTIGTVRAQGQTSPATGLGAEMSWDGNYAIFRGYNRGGSLWLDTAIDGNTVRIRQSGTVVLTCDASRTTLFSGLARHVTVSTAAGPVTMAATDDVFAANPTTSAATTYKLPAAPVAGEVHTLVDMKGIAATNTLTLDGNGKTINGAATQTITNAFGSLTVTYNGTEWNITAKF